MMSIKEIANLAGVSRGTVDRVLHDRGGVNYETECRVREIIELSEYEPNKAGKMLSIQKKNIKLGMLLLNSVSSNPFINDLISGAEKTKRDLYNYGVEVIIKQSPIGDAVKQCELIDELVKSGINGLVIMPENDVIIQKKLLELKSNEIPVITVNTDIENSGRLAYVGSDYNKSGQVAAGLMALVTNKKATVGIISGNQNILCHKERVEGFVSLIKNNYPEIMIEDIVSNNDDDFLSYELTKKLLTNNPKINALFFAAGGVFGGCKAVNDLNLSTKIRIICFDTVETTKEMINNKTINAAVDQDPKEQGSKSLRLLFDYIAMGSRLRKEFYYMDNVIKIKENL